MALSRSAMQLLPLHGAWLTHFFTVRANTFKAIGAGVDDLAALVWRAD